MSLSSGAYFGSHSMVSHGRAARALAVARLVWIGPLSRISTTGLPGWPGVGVDLLLSRASRAMKSALRLVALVATTSRRVTWSRAPRMARLCARPGASIRKVGAPLGPEMGKIGVGQGFRFVGEQEPDVAGPGLLPQQLEPQA